MTPLRCRMTLPEGHPWMVFKDPGSRRLIVVLSDLLPRGLEQTVVKDAIREWKLHQRRRRVSVPFGLGTGTGIRAGHRGQTMAAGTAAATVTAVVAGYAMTSALRTHPRPAPPVALAPSPTTPAQAHPRRHAAPARGTPISHRAPVPVVRAVPAGVSTHPKVPVAKPPNGPPVVVPPVVTPPPVNDPVPVPAVSALLDMRVTVPLVRPRNLRVTAAPSPVHRADRQPRHPHLIPTP